MVGLRLSDETVRELYFLGVLGGQASQAKVVTEWIHLAAEAVKAQAEKILAPPVRAHA